MLYPDFFTGISEDLKEEKSENVRLRASATRAVAAQSAQGHAHLEPERSRSDRSCQVLIFSQEDRKIGRARKARTFGFEPVKDERWRRSQRKATRISNQKDLVLIAHVRS